MFNQQQTRISSDNSLVPKRMQAITLTDNGISFDAPISLNELDLVWVDIRKIRCKPQSALIGVVLLLTQRQTRLLRLDIRRLDIRGLFTNMD